MSRYLVTVGRKKNALLTGRTLQQKQVQGGAAISHDWLGSRGGRRGKRHTGQIIYTHNSSLFIWT